MAPTFLRGKKKWMQRKKRKGFKAETIKRLSPRLKCYCFSHSRASIIQNFFMLANNGGRQYFSVLHGPSTLKSILPALCFRQEYQTATEINLFACKFYITVRHFHARVQSSTCTTYGKCLGESIMPVLTPKSDICRIQQGCPLFWF